VRGKGTQPIANNANKEATGQATHSALVMNDSKDYFLKQAFPIRHSGRLTGYVDTEAKNLSDF